MADDIYDRVTARKVSDLIPDDRNANQGTERGNFMLTQSLEKFGAGRSILLDKHGRVIAGNKTHAKFGELGLEDVIVVQTDGKQLVAVQRTDIELDSPAGRELALADNRVGEVNLSWDTEALAELGEDIDLTPWFTADEIEGWGGEDGGGDWEDDTTGDTGPSGASDKGEIDCVCPDCGHQFIRQL